MSKVLYKTFTPLIFFITIILFSLNNNYKKFDKINSLDQSVFKISMYDVNLIKISTATSFSVHYNLIRNESLILTNEHFCELSDTIGLIIEVSSDDFDKYVFADIIARDKNNDLCLLKINKKTTPLRLEDNCSHGDKAVIYGAPDGIFPIIIDTYISSSKVPKDVFDMKEPNEEIMMVSAMVFPGHSGSPVVKDENACGIIFAASNFYGGLATKASQIKKFINPYTSYF